MKCLPHVAVLFFLCFAGCDSTPSAKKTEKSVATQKQLNTQDPKSLSSKKKTNVITKSPLGSVQSDTVPSQAKSTGRAKPKRGLQGEKSPSLGVKTWFNLPEGKDICRCGRLQREGRLSLRVSVLVSRMPQARLPNPHQADRTLQEQ